MTVMRFAMLGTMEIAVDGHPISLGGRRQRALLAFLLLHANTAVPRDRLIDGVWGEAPPPSASESLDACLYRLRKLIGPDRLPRRAAGTSCASRAAAAAAAVVVAPMRP